MTKLFTFTCLLLIALCNVQRLPAQENELLFENYNSEKGLSQNSGYAITQDHEGFIWVGTQDGLNRFEGLGFKVYRNDTTDPHSIPFNDISSLLCDNEGRLWIGSPTGLCVYLPRQDRFYRPRELFAHYSNETDQIAINKLTQDSEGRIWILTRYRGLYRFDPDSGQLTRYLHEKDIQDKVTGIAEDVRHHTWVSTTQALYYGDGNGFTKTGAGLFPADVRISDLLMFNDELWVATMNYGIIILRCDQKEVSIARRLLAGPEAHEISSNEIKCLLKDREGNIWIGTRNAGVCLYDPQRGTIRRGWQSTLVEHSLHKNFVLSLYQDQQGITWAGLSGGGLAKYDPGKFQFQVFRQQSFSINSLPDNMIFCLFGLSAQLLLIGTQSGGMALLDLPKKTFVNYRKQAASPHSLVNNTVYGITRDRQQNLWLATWGGLCRFDPALPPDKAFTAYPNAGNENLYSVISLKNQRALLASGQTGIFLFDLDSLRWRPVKDPGNFTDTNRVVVRHFVERYDSQVWLATEGSGLLSYDYSTGRFLTHPQVYARSRNVRYILPDGESLWLGTDHGLLRYSTVSRTLTGTWTSHEGLSNDVVYAILKDAAGDLWLSTNNGLSCLNVKRNSFRNYDNTYGLQGMEFNTAACYKDAEGKLYFGGINGLNMFQPAALSANTFPPKVHITGIRVFDDPVLTASGINFTKKIELDHRHNFITFEFNALNYSHSDKNTYSYMLEGVDADWSYAGTRNFATYTQLLPGRYVFKVRAANSDGKWSPGFKQIQVNILPPFWGTWWFRSVVALAIAGVVILLFRYKTRQIRKEEQLKAEFNRKIADAERSALRAQMNPHFIFNTLNSINSYIIGNNPRVASDYLTKFARLIRIILDNSKNEWIPLSKEIETLRLYLLMESVRFNDKFEYEIAVDEKLDQENIKVPPMIIQPYVENAIWHGLLHKEEKGKVTVTIDKNRDNKLQVSISDNGIGRCQAALLKSKESNKAKSYGMKITSDRLMKSNEGNTIQTIDHVDHDRKAAGTTVILSINI